MTQSQSLAVPRVIPNDWKRLDLIVNKIKFHLGSASSPTFAGVTITGLTHSTLIGTNASKALESVTVGTGLDYTRPTLSLSHLGIEALTDPGADRIIFWDDTASASKWLAVGNSIAITTTTIDTIQDIRTSASPQWTGLTLSSLTQGSVVFAGASGVISQDNSNLFWDDTINRLGIGINSGFFPAAGMTVSGEMDLIHTATEPDDHAFELDVDAAGRGDVKAIDIDYITGDITKGEDEAVILINIDEIGATGAADVFGLEVLATEGDAGIYGMKVGVVIGPIHQDSGTFENPTIATNDTPSDNVPYMKDGLIANVTPIFSSNPNDDDYILIGDIAVFEEIEFIITTGSSGAGIKPKFEYSRAGSHLFTEFFPVDGTNGFRNTGVIAWDTSALTNHGLNTDTAPDTYCIKITRQRPNLTTTPILGFAKVAATTEYIWDESGNVNINSLTLATGIELGHASDTTITRVSAGVIAVEGTTVMMVGDAPTAHSIASHNDTTGTGAELNTLTGGGDVGALHTHAAAYQPLDDVLDDLSALTAVADNEFIVGTGAGTYAHENPATAATSMGLGTGDSPQFTGLTLTGNIILPDDGTIGVTDGTPSLLFDDTLGNISAAGNLLVSGYADIAGCSAIGPDAAYTPLITVYARKIHTITSAADNTSRSGIYAAIEVGKTGLADFTGNVYGLRTYVELVDANTQDWTSAISVRGLQSIVATGGSSTGIITGMCGLYMDSDFQDGATVTNYYGIYMEDPYVVNNKLINAYGIYLKDFNTAATLNYAIYTNAGLIHFGDAVTGLSTAAFEGASVTVGKASTTTGTIILHDSNSANTITLTVPDITAGSLTFTLPPTDGANTNVLQTDGNGVLTWAAAGGGASTWIALTDTDPANYTGKAGSAVIVNAGEDGLEFGAAPGGGFTSRASAYLANNQTVATATWTVILFDAENWDNDSEFDIITNKGRFTATAAGYYHVSAGTRLSGLNASQYLAIAIVKSGSIYNALDYRDNVGNENSYAKTSADIYLNGSTDYIEIRVYHTHGSNATLSRDANKTFVDIHRFA